MTEKENEFLTNFFSSWKNDVIERKKENLELLVCLKKAIDKYPEQRFGQIISNYFVKGDINNFFYEESKDTLDYFNENFNE